MKQMEKPSVHFVICLKFCKSVWIVLKCVLYISDFSIAIDLAQQMLTKPNSRNDEAHSNLDDPIGTKFRIMFDGYRKIFDQSLSKYKELGDILRILPGVVVQKRISMQGMANLYRIKPGLLKRFIESPIQPLIWSYYGYYILDDYLSGFLQNQGRSQLYYCDPMLQHIFICRHFLSLLDGSNDFNFQS